MTSAIVAPSRFAGLVEGLPKTYWYLWLGMLINRLGNFVLPMLMVFLTTEKHLSLVEAGAIVSLYGAGALAGTTTGGVLADRIGRRATLLISLISSALFMLLISVAATPNQLMISMALLGLATAMYQPSTQAMIGDMVLAAHRVKAFSYAYWASNLGFSLAALIGGFMAAKNFSLLFIIDAATTLAFAIIVWRAIPETRLSHAANLPGSVLTPFFDSKFVPFLVLSFAGAFILLQHLTMLPVDMSRKGLLPSDYGMAIAVNGLVIVLLQPLVAKWVVKRDRPAMLAVGSAVLGIGFGLTAFASTLGAFALTVLVWTLAEVVLAPLNSSMVSDFSPPHLRGRYQGAFSLTWSLAMMVAPTLSPMLVSLSSMSGFWLTCFALGVASALGHVIFTGRAERARLASPGAG